MKKILMALMLTPMIALAEIEVVGGVEWSYKISEEGATVIGYEGYKPDDGALRIPAELGGNPVTRIDFGSSWHDLTGLTIPETVMTIESPYYISDSPYWKNHSDGIVIQDDCVLGIKGPCPDELVLPHGVRLIANGVLNGLHDLVSITIPSSVKLHDCELCNGCENLKTVTFLCKSVTTGSSGRYSFGQSDNIQRVYIEDLAAWVKLDLLDMQLIKPGTELILLGGGGAVGGVVKLPEGIDEIGRHVFSDLDAITEVVIPEGVTYIGLGAFRRCRQLSAVHFPRSMQRIEANAFVDCVNLKDLYMEGARTPETGTMTFMGVSGDMVVHVTDKWEGRSRIWNGFWLEKDDGNKTIGMTITNVVVNYVLNSVQPEFAIPATSDTGFVNIITEVKGGAVAVPSSWADDYPTFTTKFGSDFTKALTMKTGKKDGAGNDMLVWQDYVAGTDPTKEDDVFKASITIVDGKVTISWTPELDDERKDMRKYTTWGKKSLMDKDWEAVPVGNESEYNFFKVTVEMK